jgi:hypothetical protein
MPQMFLNILGLNGMVSEDKVALTNNKGRQEFPDPPEVNQGWYQARSIKDRKDRVSGSA